MMCKWISIINKALLKTLGTLQYIHIGVLAPGVDDKVHHIKLLERSMW